MSSLLRTLLSLTTVAWLSLATACADEPTVPEPELQRELLDMFAADQRARVEMMEKLSKTGFNFETANSIQDPQAMWLMLSERAKQLWLGTYHRERLRAIVERHGWPGKSLVGEAAAGAAWLLVQHADVDVEFQKRCLALMKEAPPGEVSPKNLAYLTDRVLVNEGREQIYGTQLADDFTPRPIEDEPNVDARRAEAGLEPLAKYVETTRAAYEKLLGRE